MSKGDPITDFIKESHKEKGSRVKLEMKKSQGNAGFCIRASGSQKAIKKLADILNNIDLSKHQLEEDP